jgi:pilus assembly protein CpaE
MQILVAASDATLFEELEQAAAALRLPQLLLRQAEPRRAAQAARQWRPAVVVLELSPSLRELKLAIEELRLASPEVAVVAAFRPEALAALPSESAVLIEALRLGVNDFLRRPASAADVSQLYERFAHPAAGPRATPGRVVAFVSNKGGVGKSTLCVNTACALARLYPQQVLLIDASLQLGVCDSLLDLEPRATLTDAARQQDRLDVELLRRLATPHASGVDLLAAPRTAVEAAEVNDAVMTQVLALARRTYRVVLVDTFPLLERVVTAVVDVADRCYVVLENVVPTLQGASRLLRLLEELGCPAERLRVVVNRFRRGAGCLLPQDIAQQLNRPVDFVVPHDRRMVASANLGTPLVLRGGWFSTTTRRLRQLAHDIEGCLHRVYEGNGAAALGDVPSPEMGTPPGTPS